MRRRDLIILSAAMVLGLTACSAKNNGNNETTSQSQSRTEATGKEDDAKNTTDETQTTEKKDNNNSTDISAADIESRIADAVGKDNYLCTVDKDKNMLFARLELDESKVLDYVAKESAISAVDLDQILVFKVTDDYVDSLVDKINEDYAQTVSYVRQYPFGTAKVLNARLYKSGDYVLFVIAGASYEGEDTEAEVKMAVSEYAKIDEAVKDIFGELPENLIVVPEDDGGDTGLLM